MSRPQKLSAIRRSNAPKRCARLRSLRRRADQERVLAETLSLTAQAEAQRDLETKRAQFLEAVKRQQAQADKSVRNSDEHHAAAGDR